MDLVQSVPYSSFPPIARMPLIVANQTPLPSAPPLLDPPAITSPSTSPLGSLSDHQRAQVAELQAMIATAFGTLTGVPLQGEREWATETDDTAVRYLKACKFDIEKAHSMLTKSLQWRREFRPTEIKPEDIESESETGKAFWSGHDRQGRAIWNVDASKAKTTAPEKYLKLMAYNLEKGALLNPEGVTQLSVVADVGSTSMWNQNPVSVTLQLVNMLQNHYPEKLGMALCVNPSSFMWILWTMLSGFVDPNTKAKIFFTSSSPDANTKKRGKNEEGTAGWVSNIDDLIELDQLCSKSGGTYPYEYNHAEYWAEIKKRLWE